MDKETAKLALNMIAQMRPNGDKPLEVLAFEYLRIRNALVAIIEDPPKEEKES